MAMDMLLTKSGFRAREVDAIFSGDLMNQCVGAAYGLKDFPSPYFGLYGACSTAAEGLLLASLLVSRGVYGRVAALASSHNCTAERQYRMPLEYGGQRPPTAQWTVTGAGGFLVVPEGEAAVSVTSVLPGCVVEKGIKDVNNMGAAMAPAAADTLLRYFAESGETPRDFDLIVTGDLGAEGGEILQELMRIEGVEMGDRYNDCGCMIYTAQTQDTHAGGSGCGCSAVVLASYLLPKLASGALSRVLFLGTGAMMSPQAIRQGECIPAIAHLLCLGVAGGAK